MLKGPFQTCGNKGLHLPGLRRAPLEPPVEVMQGSLIKAKPKKKGGELGKRISGLVCIEVGGGMRKILINTGASLVTFYFPRAPNSSHFLLDS